MSKPKKKRTKKYHPGRPKIPTWAYDAWGQLTERDFKIFEDAVKIDLGLIRMGTDNGRIRISYHTAGTSVCLSDLTDQEALALQAAINDALIELDNGAYDDNVRR